MEAMAVKWKLDRKIEVKQANGSWAGKWKFGRLKYKCSKLAYYRLNLIRDFYQPRIALTSDQSRGYGSPGAGHI
jgi:hypothetical protein